MKVQSDAYTWLDAYSGLSGQQAEAGLEGTGTQGVVSSRTAAALLLSQPMQQSSGGAGLMRAQSALQRAVKELSGKVHGKVTFPLIDEYRKNLEIELGTIVRGALENAGVPVTVDFSLALDTAGSIQVACDDAQAKEVIYAYLEKNPNICEQFGYIQTLAGVSKGNSVAQMHSTAYDAQKEMQSDAVEMLLAAPQTMNITYATLVAAFEGTHSSQVQFYSGLDYTV